jgi:hypothetical protein
VPHFGEESAWSPLPMWTPSSHWWRRLHSPPAGRWIAWTFHKLQSVRAAETKIQNDLRAADKSTVEIREAERRLLSQQPNLEIAFTEVLEHRAPDGRRYLAVTVELQNSGARNLKVEFDQATLTVARYELADNHLRRLVDVYSTGVRYLSHRMDQLSDLPWRILRAGQERRVSFLAPVPSPGLYLVQFRALYGMLPFHNEPQEVRGDDRIQAVQQQVVSMTEGEPVHPSIGPSPSAGP